MFTQRTHINSKKSETIILAYSKQNCLSINQFTKYILRYTLPPFPLSLSLPTTYSSCTVSTLCTIGMSLSFTLNTTISPDLIRSSW